MTLFRLVYYSANRIDASSEDFTAQVQQILEISRHNNQLVDVTGALMFSEGYFGQVLEGSQAAIEVTFERIQQDPRHGDVSLLEFVPVNHRAFDNWAMAYVGAPSVIFSEFGAKTGFDAKKVLGERLLARLQAMVASSVVTA